GPPRRNWTNESAARAAARQERKRRAPASATRPPAAPRRARAHASAVGHAADRHRTRKRCRSARADGRQRVPAGLVHRKLAIEGRQLESAALRSHWAGDRELAPGSV